MIFIDLHSLLAKYQFYLIPHIMILLQNIILEIVCFIVLFLLYYVNFWLSFNSTNIILFDKWKIYGFDSKVEFCLLLYLA